MKKTLLLIVVCVLGVLFSFTRVSADDKSDLEAQLNQKTQMLQDIQNKKKELEKTLSETNQTNKKLSDEVKNMDNTIKDLNLSIQENKLMIEKLNLEITSLGGDIVSTEDSIHLKKETIGKLFAELQQQSQKGLISILLKNKNLSESVAETQSIENLNDNLRKNLTELNVLKGTLSEKLDAQKEKKQSRVGETENLKNRQYIFEDQKKEKQDLLKVTKNQEKIYQQQISALQKMQDEVAAEIDQIGSQLRKDINIKTLPGSGVLGMPVPGAKLTQGYGATAFAQRAYSSKWHNGYDYGVPVGTPIYAAADGTILVAENQDAYCPRGAYGKFVLIKHTNGLTTLYGHMSRYVVSVGQQVVRGELIGYIGSTGFATGPHLHFTVFATNTIPPASSGFPEGTQASRVCGPMPVGGDLNPGKYLSD
jgi:murein DD-endopeptidase MepM/ murein hydrolase activator NlpD